ncbi:efflux RND transporter periplasmic adaptor subunit [Lysobacter enzymogenes]|uniref:efflux RND transporter periplasmic adaptor subunit n=1 Tax=Lysobacter enzymogenes TaxID=69 RepID=UPI00089540F6|nr:efflux RND transporter periplasmic adaptor subunit [Lysobacter enzymogenes]SDX76034.1 membrane fusion protein, cobalt-zinc-cadmium efflux system [Lysobacter enzymogenes]
MRLLKKPKGRESARWSLSAACAALAMGAALSGCGGGQAHADGRDSAAPALAGSEYLKVETVGAGSAAAGAPLPGRVAFRPQAMTAVGSPVTARVVSVDVRPGEKVAAGAALLTLQSADAGSAKASLAQARAQTALAEDALRRQDQMVAKGVGLEVERFQAQVAVREARAELERAERAADLLGRGAGDRFVLRAPAAGVVLSLHANLGAVVAADGAALVEIGDPARVWVVADVPESEAAAIRAGSGARIHVPGAGADYAAKVDGLGPLVDGDLRRLPLYLTFADAPAPALTPGAMVEVRLDAVADAAPSVPVAAVLIKGGSQRLVYVQRGDGRFEARAVRTGASRGGRVTLLDGVRAGEKVVVEGALLLDSQAEQLL